MELDRDGGSDNPAGDGRVGSQLAAICHGEGKMTRRVLLLLAASWPRSAGAFAQAPPKSTLLAEHHHILRRLDEILVQSGLATCVVGEPWLILDRKSTRLNSSHV